jgi:hypothetical protein
MNFAPLTAFTPGATQFNVRGLNIEPGPFSFPMVSNLILQQTCEALSVRGYIEPNNHIVRGLHIALTREGRDFVIRQGYVR